MEASVYQRVLGASFDDLVPELRKYFGSVDVARVGVGSGIFEVAGSSRRWLVPALAWLGWRRVLFADFGHDIPFDIVNTPAADGSLSAVRTLHFPAGNGGRDRRKSRDRSLEDTMRVVDGRLHDFLGRRRGLEARFVLTVSGGLLRMRSDRLWLWLRLPAGRGLGRGLRIRIPRLATVTIAESWAYDLDRQHVDVRLRSPLIGEWFRYAGGFEYRIVSSR
ncbi:MAG TPA: DUF4166 domain-containing protein [Galbitalea sp.]